MVMFNKHITQISVEPTCNTYCSILFGPRATRRPSMESMKACTRCGDVSNILGHTWFSRCMSASSQPKPYTPSAMCLMAAQAVCLWTRSLKQNQTQQLQYVTTMYVYQDLEMQKLRNIAVEL